MDDLSPSAQAVLDAFFVKAGHTFPLAVAASPRAAVDQLLEWYGEEVTPEDFLGIAIELENSNVQ